MTYLCYDLEDHDYNAIDFDNQISTGWKYMDKFNTADYTPIGTTARTPDEFLLRNDPFRLIGSLNKVEPTYQDWLEAYPEYFI